MINSHFYFIFHTFYYFIFHFIHSHQKKNPKKNPKKKKKKKKKKDWKDRNQYIMKVIGTDHDARTLMVRAIINQCQANVEYEKAPQVLPRGISPTGKLPVLYGEQGQVVAFTANAIAKYVASTSGKFDQFFGKDKFSSAKIESWLSFSAEEIEHLCDACSMCEKSAPVKLSKEQFEKSKSSAKTSLVDALKNTVETHLQMETFLVGRQLTVADVRLCAALLCPFDSVIDAASRKKTLPNTSRWFETCIEQLKLREMSDKTTTATGASSATKSSAPKSTAPAGKSIVVGATVPSGIVSSTSVKTRFARSRTRVRDLILSESQGAEFIGNRITVCGWARTVRAAEKGAIQFISLNDGSCFGELQVVCSVDSTQGFASIDSSGGTGASFRIVGTLVESPAKGQAVELAAETVEVLGSIDPLKYPLAKTGKNAKGHSVEYLRQMAHLRSRTHLIGAVARVRNACAHAVHRFFHERGFLYVHTPLITASDCEGAGEMFSVTTLLDQAKANKGQLPIVDEKRAQELKADGKTVAVGSIDFTKDFFSKPSFLTVSGQLNVETYACALSDVYTFGPTFRAENSNTSRHLAEFWMIEPELCFATMEDNMTLAEDFIKYCTQYAMDTCPDDIEFFEKRVEPGLRDRLRNVIDNEFQRLTYTEAIELLLKPEHLAAGNFEEKPFWGIDLGSEHERYLTEQVFKKPVILVNYPADIKAFYMRQNEVDSQGHFTVQAMDILVPKIGEIVGGSAREERLDKLSQRIVDMKLAPEDFDWYLDTRRFGSVPHVGFGLGFERLILFVTGIGNIRDVIPFPRYPGHAEF